jgi:trimethylamine--corrinoid protein Co-methyltransferase
MHTDHNQFTLPCFRILSDKQIVDLYSAALQIMAKTGITVQCQEALDLLGSAGADVSNSDRVKIPSHLVERALKTAPEAITLYTREGKLAIALKAGSGSHFGGMNSLAEYLDPYSGERRACTVEDIGSMTRIIDALPNFEWIMTIASYPTVPEAIADKVAVLQTIRNTTKPVLCSIFDLASLREILEIGAIVSGGEKDFLGKPFLLSFSEAVTPLILGKDALEKDLFCAEKGIPNVVYSSPMAGATTPATLPATLAVSIVEFLSQVVIIQLKKPGAPVIIGSSPSIMDMRSVMYAFGAPEAYLMDAALTEIAHHYKLPTFSTSGQTDAIVIDAQAAIEATYQVMMAALCGADFVHGAGEMYQGRMASPEYAALCNEIIDMVKIGIKGIEINSDTLPLDLIEKIGPKGSYVSEKHTLKHFRNFWMPTIFDRSSVKGAGIKNCTELVKEKTATLLKTCQPKPLPDHVAKELEQIEKGWFERAGAEHKPGKKS